MNTPACAWEKQISYFASQLSDRFPDLELRFTMTLDKLTLNVDGCASVDFALGDTKYESLLNEATFTIKMILGRFDA